MNKISLCCNNKNDNFVKTILSEIKKIHSDVEIVQYEKIDNDTLVWHLLNDKEEIPADIVLQFDNLGMRCGKSDKNYYLQIDRKLYNRLEYENFTKLAEEKGIKFSIGKYILMFELSFPLTFWSLTKQKKISQQIFRQQCQVLVSILLGKGENKL